MHLDELEDREDSENEDDPPSAEIRFVPDNASSCMLIRNNTKQNQFVLYCVVVCAIVTKLWMDSTMLEPIIA